VIDRIEHAGAQKLSELSGIDAIGLVAALEEMVLTGITDDQLGDQRLDQIIEPGSLSAFFEGEVDGSRQRVDEIANFLKRGSDG